MVHEIAPSCVNEIFTFTGIAYCYGYKRWSRLFCTNQYIFLNGRCLIIYFYIYEFEKISKPIAALGVNNFHQPVFVRKYETYVDALKYTKCLMKSNFIHTKPSVIFRN